jgi:hypothetical protein
MLAGRRSSAKSKLCGARGAETARSRLFTDSPWSRTVSVIVVSPPRSGGLDENEGGGGERGAGTTPAQFKVVISWRSALPMKQALVGSQIGVGGAVTAENQQRLERTEPVYEMKFHGQLEL